MIKDDLQLTWDQNKIARSLGMRSTSHAHCDYFEAQRIVGVFRPYSPVKMSDMEDDFMCDDEEDYDLVN